MKNYPNTTVATSILRKNDRHETRYDHRTNIVTKTALTPWAQASLKREHLYMLLMQNRTGISTNDPTIKFPEMKVVAQKWTEDYSALQIPFYPGEAMNEVKEMVAWRNDEGVKRVFYEILSLAGRLRTPYTDTLGTLQTDCIRLWQKYIDVLRSSQISEILRDNTSWAWIIQEIIDSSKENLDSFPYYNEEYLIHGCLNLEHIRRDIDGRLVPIDFEHGANFPRRLKYQDEAYIFQNILQHIDDENIAEIFLEAWLSAIDYKDDEVERTHANRAISEKMLGWIFELHSIQWWNMKKKILEHLRVLEKLTKWWLI